MKTKAFITVIAACLLFLGGIKAINVFTSKKARNTDKSVLIAEITRNLGYNFSKASILPAYYSNLNKLANLPIAVSKTVVGLQKNRRAEIKLKELSK
ncbi:hypothetical protein [Mucilaginibacter arboris]|uniref:Uncharacterized protein n=1 Tax=Mucilaginibacter arboris TaxID=2682090 RepID=A0A7K1SVT5_9SPHI|nr:hypothetical protein [Mucilaginibacter arboris]MVN21436.1 hypothetical protein [Mucilaginibacter arboris]